MCQSKSHRHLLKHPVITSFLYLKWARIRRDFNRNLRFYLLFVYVLTWYIFEKFGHIKKEEQKLSSGHAIFIPFAIMLLLFILRDWTMDFKEALKPQQLKNTSSSGLSGTICVKLILRNWIEVAFLALIGFILLGGAHLSILWSSLLILTILLLIREFFQVMVSLKRYLVSPENWLEVTVILLIGIILFEKEDDDLQRHLSAVAIVLSWAELITLVGKHPKLTHIQCVCYHVLQSAWNIFLFPLLVCLFYCGIWVGILYHAAQAPRTRRNKRGLCIFQQSLVSPCQNINHVRWRTGVF